MLSRMLIVLMLMASLTVWAQVQVSKEPLVFQSEAQQERFSRLTNELRCLVCQNQNLADSDAPLAHDLRMEVYRMMNQGLTDDQIKQFLVERYGDFVLYMPPVKGNTLILWVAPLVLLAAGSAVVAVNIRRRRKMLTGQADD
ncbi:MAG: cytochrome c-type biogenesis protein [Xanthomonadales bacterium]|nr:cytochrome c-type biogenesis protein [Xanthomonadales bacterium]